MAKQIKQAESGRTMVEMLGTLAIIGVLSIGGVTGYGRAIKTYRTNSAIETAQRQAAIVAGDVGLGQAVSPGSATVIKAPSGYEVAVKDMSGGATDINSTTPYFGVEIGGGTSAVEVPREVAEQMFERAVGEWKNVHGFGIKSGNSVTWLGSNDNFDNVVGADAKTVIIIVVYMSDLSPRTGDLKTTGFDVTPGTDPNTCNPTCDQCYECQAGECVATSEGACTTELGEAGTCNDGTCEPILECLDEEIPCGSTCCPSGTTCGENDECCKDGVCCPSGRLYCEPKYTYFVDDHGEQTCGGGWQCCPSTQDYRAPGTDPNQSQAGICCPSGENAYCAGGIDGICQSWMCCPYEANRWSLYERGAGFIGECGPANAHSYCEKRLSENGPCRKWGYCTTNEYRDAPMEIVAGYDRGNCCTNGQIYCAAWGANECQQWECCTGLFHEADGLNTRSGICCLSGTPVPDETSSGAPGSVTYTCQ